MKTHGIAAALISTLVLVGPTATYASTAPEIGSDQPPSSLFEDEERVTLVMAGGEPSELTLGEKVPWHTIKQAGYGIVDPTAMEGTTTSESGYSVATAAPSDRYDILAYWHDKMGRYVLERNGWWDPAYPSDGFGWRKAYYKHDLTTSALKTITGKYWYYENDGGYRWVYRTTMTELTCTYTQGCWVTDRLTARAVWERSNWDGSMFGLVTAYCEGYYGKCPSWVKHSK